MKTGIIAYFATAFSFLALDAVWLSTMTSRLYKPKLEGLLAETVSIPPAILFYLLYFAGIVIFVIQPSVRWSDATWRGAAFGLVAYATYDLTNQATMRGWPTVITVADLGWGMFITAFAASLGFLAAKNWG